MTEAVYATAAELRAQPGITGAGDDLTLDLFLMAASRAIDGFTNRPDGYVAGDSETREFTGSGLPSMWVGDMCILTEVAISEDGTNFTTIDLSEVRGFQGAPEHPNFNRSPFYGLLLMGNTFRIFPQVMGTAWFASMAGNSSLDPNSVSAAQVNVMITGCWGYAVECPTLIKTATIAQAARWFKRGQSFWADASADNTSGVMLWKQALDPDIKMMLQLSRLKRPLYGG